MPTPATATTEAGEALAILDAVLDARLAWSSVGEIARALGSAPELVADLVVELEVAGWLEAWDRDPDPVVTLTPLGAERLGVRLVEDGPDLRPRWARPGDPDPPAPRAPGVCRSAGALELVVDDRPGPGDGPAGKSPPLPRPNVLLGSGLAPWPGPGPSGPPCPGCRGRALGPSSYCLVCDRWGLDALLSAGPPRPRRDRPAEAGRRLEQAKLARRAERRARLAARPEPTPRG